MRLHPEPFRFIESGEKRVECRVNDEKRQGLAVDDTLVLTLRDSDPPEALTRTIIGLHTFPSFETMFERFPEESGGTASGPPSTTPPKPSPPTASSPSSLKTKRKLNSQAKTPAALGISGSRAVSVQ